MKRKSIIAFLIVLCMAFTFTLPALATEADGPQGSVVDNPSDGETRLTSNDGEIWSSDGDDTYQDTHDPGNPATADIAVWAKIIDIDNEQKKIYCVDIEWGNMKFVFGTYAGWDTVNHTYAAEGEGEWFVLHPEDQEGYLNGENNRIMITNHSNDGITATFAYEFVGMTNNLFNNPGDSDRVVGNFFGHTFEEYSNDILQNGNSKAIEASTFLTDDDKEGLEDLILPESAIDVASADLGPGEDNAAQSEEVFFAFSGTPTKEDLEEEFFQKVGIITVTITPETPLAPTDPGG